MGARWEQQAVQVLREVVGWDRFLTREEEPAIAAARALLAEHDGVEEDGTGPLCNHGGRGECSHVAHHDEDDDGDPQRCWFHAEDKSRIVE